MNKLKKFTMRKLRELGADLLILVITIPSIALIFAGMALPGVVIAFLTSGNNPEAIVLGGLLSLIGISLVWITTGKIKKVVREYKNFNGDEEC